MKDLFLAYVGKTLNIPVDEVAAILYKKADDGTLTDEQNEAALTDLLQRNADHAQTLKGDAKQQFDLGFKKAEKQISDKWERQIREKAGITDKTLIGDELLTAAFTEVDTPEDKVKRSPLFINLEKQLSEKEAAFQIEKEAAIAEVLATQQRDKTRLTAKETVKTYLRSLGPLLPDDTAKAERSIELFVSNLLSGLDFDPDASGNILSIIQDGKRKEDAHGHAYTLERLTKEAAEQVYDFRAQPEKGQAGNKNEPAPPKPAGSTDVPKTLQEYNDKILTITDPKEQAALTTAFLAASQQ